MSISVIRFATIGIGVTYLVHNVDKGLCVIPKERMDRVTFILSREDGLNQRGEFTQSEAAPNQTFTGWRAEVEKVGTIGILQQIGEGVPLSEAGVAEASAAFWFRMSVLPLRRSGALAARVRVAIFAGVV